mgnify:CR=1 FL=1
MGRHSKAVKLVGGVRGGLALLDDDERRRAIEAGERDIDDGVGFFAARLGLVERGSPNRPHRSSGCRTPERTETGYYANQAAQAAPL